MLHARQVDQPYTWERDHITGDYIMYGEWYYWDDEDGLIVSVRTYNKMKEEKRRAEWDYSRLEEAQSEQEYRQMLQEHIREIQTESLLNRKVEGKD